MSILEVAIQNMLAHENVLDGDTTPVKPHIKAWQKQISDRIAFSRFMLAFEAQLTHTAVPDFARSGTVGTYTRATTSTWPNNDGYQVTGVAGEIGFVGARRVRNLLPSSEDLTSGWTATGGTLAAGSITESGATSGHYAQTTSMVIPATAIFIMQAEIKQSVGTRNIGIGTNSVGNAIFNPSTGVFVANDGATLDHGTGTQTADGYWPVWVKVQATTSNKPIISLYSGTTQSYAGDGASQVLVRKFQLEDVTAQTTQTAGEYVSVGVESAPYYHGSMVDGVKCFATDINGAAIPSTTLLGYQAQGARTNLCLQSNAFTTTWTANNSPTLTQNAVGPDGAASAWTMTDDSALPESVYQYITLTAAQHTFSVFVKKTTGAQTGYPVLTMYPGVAAMAACTIDTSNGVATAFSAYTGFTIASAVTARCESFNDDFWRVSLSWLGTAAAWTIQLHIAGTTNPTQSTGAVDNAAQGTHIFYGAQVELGSFASSYIPTTTIAVARNADVLTYSSAGNIDKTTGWISAEAISNDTTGGASLYGTWVYNDGAGNAGIFLGYASSVINFGSGGNAVFNTNASSSNSVTAGNALRTAATWGSASKRVALNGTVGSSQTFTPALTGSTNLYIGQNSGAGSQIYGTIRNVRIGQRALSSSELQAITA